VFVVVVYFLIDSLRKFWIHPRISNTTWTMADVRQNNLAEMMSCLRLQANKVIAVYHVLVPKVIS